MRYLINWIDDTHFILYDEKNNEILQVQSIFDLCEWLDFYIFVQEHKSAKYTININPYYFCPNYKHSQAKIAIDCITTFFDKFDIDYIGFW